MSHIVEINDIQQLGRYRLLWDCLLGQTPGASFFQTIDWLQIYWRHFGDGQQLRVLIVYAADQPVGIVPLCVRTERFRVGRLRVLTYPLHDWGTFYGPIGPDRTACLLAALAYLRGRPRDWDLMDLRWTDAQRHDRGRTPRAMRVTGFPCTARPWAVTAVLRLAGTWDRYVAGHSKKWRANRRREERRLAELGTVTHQRYRPLAATCGQGDPRWDLWDDCQHVAHQSWQARSTTGTTITHAAVKPFLKEAHAAAARLGMLDLNLLRLDGQPIAFTYNYCHEGSVIGLRMGFDSRWAMTGCGNVLQARMIRDSFRRGDHRYEMGPGTLRFKQLYCSHLETCYQYTYYPGNKPRVVALRLKRRIDTLLQHARSRAGRTTLLTRGKRARATSSECGDKSPLSVSEQRRSDDKGCSSSLVAGTKRNTEARRARTKP